MAGAGLDFSVVVPTRDRPEQLVRCLAALASLDYPGARYEIVVVDDGSRRRPDLPPRAGPSLRLIELRPGAGPAAARNAGAAAASGRFLAFTDDDCAPRADWLAQLARRLEADPGALVGGRAINAVHGNVYSEASQVLLDYVLRYFDRSAGARFVTSNNLALERGVFERLGGFDPRFPLPAAEDRDLCRRAADAGHPVVYAPEVLVDHFHDLSAGGFARQHFRYGRGAAHYRDAAGLPLLALEPMSFYGGMVRHALAADGAGKRTAALLVLAQLGSAAGYFAERARSRVSRGRSAKAR